MAGSDTASAIVVEDPTTFPLAKACRDHNSLIGKKIRLSFLRGSSNHKGKFPFVWPAIMTFLVGERSFHNDPAKRESWKQPLDEWAMNHREVSKTIWLEEKKTPSGGS